MGIIEKLESALGNVTMQRYIQTTRPTKPIYVCKVKGEKDAQILIESMLSRGYKIDQMDSRKAAYSPLTGIFTGKSIITLVFKRHD